MLKTRIGVQVVPIVTVNTMISLIQVRNLIRYLHRIVRIVRGNNPFLIKRIRSFKGIVLQDGSGTALVTLLLRRRRLQDQRFNSYGTRYIWGPTSVTMNMEFFFCLQRASSFAGGTVLQLLTALPIYIAFTGTLSVCA